MTSNDRPHDSTQHQPHFLVVGNAPPCVGNAPEGTPLKDAKAGGQRSMTFRVWGMNRKGIPLKEAKAGMFFFFLGGGGSFRAENQRLVLAKTTLQGHQIRDVLFSFSFSLLFLILLFCFYGGQKPSHSLLRTSSTRGKKQNRRRKKTKNKETCASRSRPRPFTRPLSSVPGPVPFRPAEAEALFAGLELKVFDHLSAKGGLTARQASGNRFFGPRGWAGLAGLVAAPLFRRVAFFGEGAEPFSFGFSFSTPHPGGCIFFVKCDFCWRSPEKD